MGKEARLFKSEEKKINIQASLISQYYAALEMLRQAILHCPEPLWLDDHYPSPFWHIAFHVLFYTHFYLGDSEASFEPWEHHQDALASLSASEIRAGGWEPYSREEMLAYLAFCWDFVQRQLPTLELSAESGFDWLPFDKLELQLYNLRHLQQHTGELYERLGPAGGRELPWVGRKPDDL